MHSILFNIYVATVFGQFFKCHVLVLVQWPQCVHIDKLIFF